MSEESIASGAEPTEPAAPAAPAESSVASAVMSRWMLTLLVGAGVLGMLGVLYFETFDSVVAIWIRSETYAHGFLILPISLWLIWELRVKLARMVPEPALLPIVLLLPFGFAWLLGSLADALVVQQLALVFLLVIAVWAMIGNRVGRLLAFPLLFLVFAVPMGDGLVPPLMDFTADFTVRMLRLTDIPVYREGNHFSIPTGDWAVIEACSGLRYVIASVTLGVLFAYMSFTKLYKRLIFFVFACIVPVIANGLRAYMIVMIGHLSDMKLATGVDHLIYGWVFFGVIITFMFLIGSIWRDPPREHSPEKGPLPAPPSLMRLLSVAVPLVAVLAVWPIIGSKSADSDADAQVVVQAPESGGGWTTEPANLWDWRPSIQRADGEIYRFYQQESSVDKLSKVGLYLGVYRTQRQGAELINHYNVMVKSNHRIWTESDVTGRSVALPDRELSLQEHLLSSRFGKRLVVWSWFRVGDYHMSNRYLAKLTEAVLRLTGQHREGTQIAVAAPYIEDPQTARETLRMFLTEMLPAVDEAVNRSVGLAP